jgi:phosphatidylglycerophosphate synthase
VWGKATTFFELSLIFLVLVLAVWNNNFLWFLRNICPYFVATFVIVSGLHYSITVSRQLHAGS